MELIGAVEAELIHRMEMRRHAKNEIRNQTGKEVELGRLRPMMRSAQTCAIRSGRSVAWYARLLGVQKVVSSNLTAPTIEIQKVPNVEPFFISAPV